MAAPTRLAALHTHLQAPPGPAAPGRPQPCVAAAAAETETRGGPPGAPWSGFRAFDDTAVGSSAFEQAAGPFFYSPAARAARFVVEARHCETVFDHRCCGCCCGCGCGYAAAAAAKLLLLLLLLQCLCAALELTTPFSLRFERAVTPARASSRLAFWGLHVQATS